MPDQVRHDALWASDYIAAMPLPLGPLLALAILLAMEGVAYAVHRWIMHGPGWALHKSHHAPRSGPFEANDWYAVVFAAPSLALFLIADGLADPLWWVALGIAGYGLVYALFHDVLVHRRLPHRLVPRSTYLKRLVQAHRLHHAVHGRDGAVSFGFLWAPRPEALKRQLRASTIRPGRPPAPAAAPRATPAPPA